MCQTNLTRRQLMRYAALVAATLPAARVLEPGWSLAGESGPGNAVPMNLELVTVTDTQAVVTWFTGDPTQDMRSYRKIDDYNLEMTVKKAGKVTLTGRLVISADGKSRTVTITGTDAKGEKFTSTAVYDKQ